MAHPPLLVDVSPRDGLQNEERHLSTADKVALIRRIAAAGVRAVEVTSFVSPSKVPQMADADEVAAAVSGDETSEQIALVVNDRGFDRAVAAGLRHVRLVVAATDTMNRRNANRLPAETMAAFRPLLERAGELGVRTVGVVAVAFGCPFEGAVDPAAVLDLGAQFVALGASEIDFADTVGMGVPTQVERMLVRARREYGPQIQLGVHLHNTRNTGIANAYAALSAGVDVIDASTGGAGGCPFAPRATGNIPMEDLAFMLEGMGVETGIDLDRLIETAAWLEGRLGRQLPGMVMKAGTCWTNPPPTA